jgi:hypothetical protein
VHYWAAPSGRWYHEALRYRRLAVAEPFARRGVRKYSLKTIGTEPGPHGRPTRSSGSIPTGNRSTRLVAWSSPTTRTFEHVTVFDDAHADDAYHALIKDVENGYTRSAALVVPEGPGLALARLWIRAGDGRAAERDGDRVRPCGDLAPVAEIAIWRADRPHH